MLYAVLLPFACLNLRVHFVFSLIKMQNYLQYCDEYVRGVDPLAPIWGIHILGELHSFTVHLSLFTVSQLHFMRKYSIIFMEKWLFLRKNDLSGSRYRVPHLEPNTSPTHRLICNLAFLHILIDKNHELAIKKALINKI